jgi:NTE family protein
MRIGLALGGGGAKGLAHIPILETLDELGIAPTVLSGTSMGAIIASLYASGRTGAELRADVDELLFRSSEKDSHKVFDLAKGFRLILELADFDFGAGGILGGGRFIEELFEGIRARTFEELAVPLKIVAADFWTREEVVLESGDLRMAVRASMSLPVIFSPVRVGESVLMDGGAVNPVPYDLLLDHCDAVIAVDVGGERLPDPADPIPSLSESIFNTFQIMSKAILDEKLRHRAPTILVKPPIRDVQTLEFDKAQEIYAQCAPACDELREKLAELPETQ